MNNLRPFLHYFGSKWLMANVYGPPLRRLVIEPFAGSAGYSTRWNPDKVILIDKNPTIIGIWRYLISASYDDIMDIPIVLDTDEIPDSFPQAVKDLVGFNLGRGDVSPRKRMTESTKYFRDRRPEQIFGWTMTFRERIAKQVQFIRHWEIIEGDCFDAPDEDAHWHIDPPYQLLGKSYKCKFTDYDRLAEFCRNRKGIVDVCESEGADWLPFEPLYSIKSQNNKKFTEVVARFQDGKQIEFAAGLEPSLSLFEDLS